MDKLPIASIQQVFIGFCDLYNTVKGAGYPWENEFRKDLHFLYGGHLVQWETRSWLLKRSFATSSTSQHEAREIQVNFNDY